MKYTGKRLARSLDFLPKAQSKAVFFDGLLTKHLSQGFQMAAPQFLRIQRPLGARVGGFLKPVAKLLGVGAALVPIEKVHTVAVLSPEGKEALGGFTPSLQGGLERNLARFGGLRGEKRGWGLAEYREL